MLRMVLSEERIDRVVVAFGVTRESDMVDVFRACEDASVEIHVLPRFFELATAMNSRNVDDVWGYPLLRLRRSLLRRNARIVKRVFDATVAAFALLRRVSSLRRHRRRGEADEPGPGPLPPAARGRARRHRRRPQVPVHAGQRPLRRRVEPGQRRRDQDRPHPAG